LEPIPLAAPIDSGVMAMPAMDLVAPIDPGPAVAADPVDPPDEPRPIKRRSPPRQGKVSVRVAPWAEVIYNGKNFGPTPLPGPIDVPAGTATFTLRNKQLGVTRKVTVKVAPGETVVLKADLFKK
jgi:hypothetical protein